MAWRILLYLFIGGTTLVLTVYFMEKQILYQPISYPDGNWDVPEQKEALHDVRFNTEDGVRLHGWWAPREGASRTVLWFHGNAGNLSHRYEDFMMLHRLGCQVLIVDYRGYGRSDGSPSEKGLYRDGFAAYRFLVERKDVPEDELILLGRSLGAGVATKVAAERTIRKLILVSPFTNVPDMVPYVLPVPGLRHVVSSSYDSLSRIRDVKVPLLVLHGTEDAVVPFDLGRKLFESANDPKSFVELPGAGHNNIGIVAGDRYRSALRSFIFDDERVEEDNG